MTTPVAIGLALDSNESVGVAEEVTSPVPMGHNNTVKVQVLVYALTATNVSITVEGSSDGYNWDALGSAQTATSIGRKLFNNENDVAVAFVRLKISVTGTGIAILDAYLHPSPQ